MSLDPAVQQLVNNWLHAKCPSLRCPACGGSKFGAGEVTVGIAVPHHKPGPLVVNLNPSGSNPLTPTVPVVCSHCGFMLSFSAGVMGVVT